jgi:hypothetical protein
MALDFMKFMRRKPAVAADNASVATPTVATQGAASSVAPGGVGGGAGMMTPPAAAARPSPVVGNAAPGPIPNAAAGTMTFMRQNAVAPGAQTNAVPGAAVTPVDQLGMGGRSAVMPAGMMNRPTGRPFDGGRGVIEGAGPQNAFSAGSIRDLAASNLATNQAAMRPSDAAVEMGQARTNAMKRGFMSPGERKTLEGEEQRGFMRGMVQDKLASAEKVAESQAAGEVAKAGFMQRPELGRFKVEPIKNADGSEDYVTIDTTTGERVQPKDPQAMDSYNSLVQSKRGGRRNAGDWRGSDKDAIKKMDDAWLSTGLPLEQAPHRLNPRGDAKAKTEDTPRAFASPEEAEKANLPPGTIVMVNGRRAVVE